MKLTGPTAPKLEYRSAPSSIAQAWSPVKQCQDTIMEERVSFKCKINQSATHWYHDPTGTTMWLHPVEPCCEWQCGPLSWGHTGVVQQGGQACRPSEAPAPPPLQCFCLPGLLSFPVGLLHEALWLNQIQYKGSPAHRTLFVPSKSHFPQI